jgi:hypothetical protein
MWTVLPAVDREPLGSVAGLTFEREDGGPKVRTAGCVRRTTSTVTAADESSAKKAGAPGNTSWMPAVRLGRKVERTSRNPL